MSQPTNLSPEFIVSSGLDQLRGDQIQRAVYVSNLAPSVTSKDVSDFFSFCGNLENIIQGEDPMSTDKRQFAVVIFEEEAAASTALLLSNAVIGDSPIAVQPYGNSVPQASPSQGSTSPSTQRSATAVVASLAAAGYLKGEGVLGDLRKKATEYDGKLNLSAKAMYAFEVSRKAAQDLDRDFQITATLTYIKEQTMAGARSINETYHIGDYVNQAANTAGQMANKALDNETVKKGVEWLASGWTAASTALWSTWSDLETQTMTEIEKKKGSPETATLLAESPAPASEEVHNSPQTGEEAEVKLYPTVDL